MRSFVVNRNTLTGSSALPEHDSAATLRTLDTHELPDRTPFVIEDDATFDGCWPLNQYVLDALSNDGLSPHSLRCERLPVLKRFTQWLRAQSVERAEAESDDDSHARLKAAGGPKLSPLVAERRDLVNFKEARAKMAKVLRELRQATTDGDHA